MPLGRIGATALAIAAASFLLAGCADSTVGTIGGKVRVVAAENTWGSIARQLGGAHADVESLIRNPAQDPHSYEPTTSDARAMATAQLAIVNGIGYDPWAPELLAANPTGGRITLSVGRLLGLHHGDNPHRWYDPADVVTVAHAITAALTRLYPAQHAYFAARLHAFETVGLAAYHGLIERIRERFAGVPVGASESIFAPLAPALGLRLITPPGFLNSVSEGTDVTAADQIAAERQITSRQIAVWVFNTQNVTPEVQRLNGLARAARIPIAHVTETLSPEHATFQQWQVGQLRELESALARATGR